MTTPKTSNDFYPIGLAGRPWGEAQRAQWRARQSRQRSYSNDVTKRIDALAERFDKIEYGMLTYDGESYRLQALQSRSTNPSLPTALITGGVHGYETSGVLGVLAFLERHGSAYAGTLNLLAAPCVSPWAYERISRWNYDAADPNRNFRPDGPAREAAALIELVSSFSDQYLVHVDLHETTQSDESEFRPALSARDGASFEPCATPEGFYLVADAAAPQLAFQRAIIGAVEKITPIAQADAKGEIIGSPVIAHGVIAYPMAELHLCASITNARFASTTEICPDAPNIDVKICVEAQVAALCAALDFALDQSTVNRSMDCRP